MDEWAQQQARFGALNRGVTQTDPWAKINQRKKQLATKPKGRGGFLSSLISEGGGIGGAVAGGSAGSFLGPIGTLVGAGIGGAVGAFGGRLTENKIRDDEFRVGDAIKEGAVSGVLGASPIRLLKGAGAAGKALATGGKALPAFEKAATAPGIASKILGRVGNKAAGKSIGASPSQLTGFRTKTGEDLVQFAKRIGGVGKSADELKQLQPAFQEAYEQSVLKSGASIDADMLEKLLNKSSFAKGLASKSTTTRKLYTDALEELTQAVGNKRKLKAADLLKLRQDYDQAIGSYAFGDARKGVDQKVADFLRTAIREVAPEAKGAGKNAQKLKMLTEVVDKQSDKGRGALSIGLTDLLATGAGGAAGGVPGGIAAVAAKRAINSPKAQATISNIASNASERGAARALRPGSASSIARRQLPVRGAEAILGAGTAPAEALEGEVIPQGFESDQFGGELPRQMGAGSVLGTPTGSQGQEGIYSRESVAQDIQRDLQATGGQNMDKYIKLYEFLNPEPKAGANKPGYGRPSAQQYSLANAGVRGVDQLSQMLSQDPSVLSRTATPGQKLPIVGGLISRLAGTGEYQATAQNTLDALSRARTGAAITPSEERFYERLLPRAGDNPATIQNKLMLLQQNFEPFMGYGQESGGADILSELQGAY